MKSLQPTNSSDINARDRRSWTRYSTNQSDVIIQSAFGSVSGKLVDESIGGIGVQVESVEELAFSQEVHIQLRDSDSIGYIRSIHRESPTQFRVSISWNDFLDVAGKRRKPIAHFVVHDHLLFVCDLLFHDAGPKTTVRLWDGARFDIDSDLVCSRSFDARRSELNRGPDLMPTLATVYGLAQASRLEDLVAQILDFEFSFSERRTPTS